MYDHQELRLQIFNSGFLKEKFYSSGEAGLIHMYVRSRYISTRINSLPTALRGEEGRKEVTSYISYMGKVTQKLLYTSMTKNCMIPPPANI